MFYRFFIEYRQLQFFPYSSIPSIMFSCFICPTFTALRAIGRLVLWFSNTVHRPSLSFLIAISLLFAYDFLARPYTCLLSAYYYVRNRLEYTGTFCSLFDWKSAKPGTAVASVSSGFIKTKTKKNHAHTFILQKCDYRTYLAVYLHTKSPTHAHGRPLWINRRRPTAFNVDPRIESFIQKVPQVGDTFGILLYVRHIGATA